MPLKKNAQAGTKGRYVPDSMTTDESDAKFKKKGLQDKMNRAPEYNRGIANGKRKRNAIIEV